MTSSRVIIYLDNMIFNRLQCRLSDWNYADGDHDTWFSTNFQYIIANGVLAASSLPASLQTLSSFFNQYSALILWFLRLVQNSHFAIICSVQRDRVYAQFSNKLIFLRRLIVSHMFVNLQSKCH